MSSRTAWSISLGQVRGIPVKVHLSFFLFVAWIGYEHLLASGGASGVSGAFSELLFSLAVFLCVLLHELGHALMARRFGIRTKDIVLYPFGGVATILGETRPKAELFIALAGPAVNIIIAAAAYYVSDAPPFVQEEGTFVTRIMEANLILAIFNLLPALPMDGGRILRAGLALIGLRRATLISARLSQILTVLLGAAAIYIGHPILLLIAIFVFLGAVREVVYERTRIMAHKHQVTETMSSADSLLSLTHGMTVSHALSIVLKTVQPFFPVMLGSQFLGIIHRDQILRSATTGESDEYISGLMDRNPVTSASTELLTDLIERFGDNPPDVIAVVDDGAFRGLVLREIIFEFLMVHGIRRERSLEDS